MVIGQFSMVLVHILSLYRVEFKSKFFNYFTITFKLIPWSMFAALSWHTDHINYPRLTDTRSVDWLLLGDSLSASLSFLHWQFCPSDRAGFCQYTLNVLLQVIRGKNVVYKGEMRIFVIQLMHMQEKLCCIFSTMDSNTLFIYLVYCFLLYNVLVSCFIMLYYYVLLQKNVRTTQKFGLW